MKSVKFNVVLSMIQTGIKILFPLITFPYVSRVLGVDQIGRYNFSNSIISYFVMFAGLGINTYAIREGSKYRDDKYRLETFASELYSINICSMMIAYVVLGVVTLFIPLLKTYRLIIGILSIQILFTTVGKSWIYTIYEDYVFITIRTIIFQIVSFFSLFLFVKKETDLIAYTIITTFALAGNEIVNAICCRKYSSVHFNIKINTKHLKPILFIFSTTISITIYQSSDITMLGIWGNDYYVGLYSVSAKIYNIIKQMLAVVLTVTIPRFSYYCGKRMLNEYKQLFVKVLNTLLVIILPISIGGIMVSETCIKMVFGREYAEASLSLQLLLIALIFNLGTYMLGYCVLLPNGMEKKFFEATLIGAAINVILNIFMIPQYYQNATAFTTVIAEFVSCFYCFMMTRNVVSYKGIIQNIKAIAVGCIWIILVCSLGKQLQLLEIQQLLFSIFVSIVGYCIIQIILKNETFVLVMRSFVDLIIKRISHKQKD